MGDRVLGDLHHDHLTVLQQPLDLRLAAALEVGLVERDVAPVQHTVLRRADVDERGLHAGQHVLHPTEIDVAVDGLGARGRGERVLDQAAALEDRDVRVATLDHVDAHEIAAGGTTLAGAAASPFEHVVVGREERLVADTEIGSHDVAARSGGCRRTGGSARRGRAGSTTTATATTSTPAFRRGCRSVGDQFRPRPGVNRRSSASPRVGRWARDGNRRYGLVGCGPGPPLRAPSRRRRRW